MESTSDQVKLEASWKNRLAEEFTKPYMLNLKAFLKEQKQKQAQIFPKGPEYFAALNLTPFDDVKVVILGQDPYHGEGQAHGLCFSVRPGTGLPPSLQNIYKEMKTDLGIDQPPHGYLESWAKQGVLLLNSVLTVEKSKPGSHQKRGWEEFTDKIIALLNERQDPVAFMLWGAYAQAKGQFIDTTRHLVLKSAHPSPFSVHRGFFGSRQFSKVNAFLKQHGKAPINWQLPAVTTS